MAVLKFYTGTMDSGKSTLALQLDYNHRARGRAGLMFSSQDRAGAAIISSRLGISATAIEVEPAFDFWSFVVDELSQGQRIDYVVCDEVQFYSVDHIEALARIVDELGIDVYAFGILTDFRTRLFAGSARMIELADQVVTLQVETLCWCGALATHNARTINGEMVTEGDVIVVGDTGEEPTVGYEVLCRKHHRGRLTAVTAQAAPLSAEVLPFHD